MNARAAAFTAVVFLGGCGGGGISSTSPQPGGRATPAPGPALRGTATLTLVVPRRAPAATRHAKEYVSPNSAFLVVTVVSVDGQPPTASQVPTSQNGQTFALSTAAGGNCTNSATGATCTVTVPAPTGQVGYQFDLFDASNRKLATQTQVYTIAAGSTSTLQAVLQGIVASVVFIAPALGAGTSFSGPITVEGHDASGALIVGSASYMNPFTATDGDSSGATSLTINGTTGASVTVSSPNDVVILNYDGSALDPFAISATIPGQAAGAGGSVTVAVQNAPVTFPGTPNDTASASDPNFNQPTLTFNSLAQTLPFTAAEVGWSDHGTRGFTVALDAATCGSGASAVVTIAPAPSTDNRTFNVTSQHSGLCEATVTGGPPGNPKTGVIWFNV